jgi:signal transduction histidine kinase
MAADTFPRLISLACHDLRTPLATIFGFARTLNRMEEQDARTSRFLGMIEEASAQMTELLDELAAVARIQDGRWEPTLREADTLELASVDDPRVAADGRGETIETDMDAVRRALRAFAIAAARFGPVEQVAWRVDGRALELSPVTPDAAPVVTGETIRDLGSLVGRAVIEALGGSCTLVGETFRVRL